MPTQYAEALLKGTGRLSGGAEAWVTAADNLAGIDTIEGAAKRLTLVDGNGQLRLGGNAIVEFNIRDSAPIASPYNRSNPGFVNGGRTGGGAREWFLPSDIPIYNVSVRYLR